MDQKAAIKKAENDRKQRAKEQKLRKTQEKKGASIEAPKNPDIEINLPIPPELKDIVEDSDDDF